jgi:pimeloyl-ACP methyl ester carboxylesterase
MKWLRRVELPSLIVWGAEDRILPPAHALAFQDALPQSELEIIPACGHLPHVENKDAFVARLSSFIQGAGQ